MLKVRGHWYFILLLVLPCVAQGGIGLRFERSLTIPGLGDSISFTSFAQPDTNQEPVLLASNGQSIILYSMEKDTLLFKRQVAQNGESCSQVLFADVNRDSVPDLICGLRSRSFYRVLLLDGASQYRDSSSRRFHHSVPAGCGEALDNLTIVNLNGDRWHELVVSVDSSGADEFGGMTRMYVSFPDSVGWTAKRPAKSITEIPMPDKTRLLWAEPSGCERKNDPNPASLKSTPNLFSLNSKGEMGKFNTGYPNPCGARPPQFHAIDPVLRLYRYDPSYIAQTELVTEVTREYHCGDDTVRQVRHTLTYFLMYEPGALEHVWSWDTNSKLTGFTFIPGFSGYFFAFTEKTMVMYRLSDGTVATHLEEIPANSRGWEYPVKARIPQLVCLNGNSINLYSLDITTDALDDGVNGLPVIFQLSEPAPLDDRIGFRFSVDVPRAGDLKVEVLNKAGKQVAVLFDGQSEQVRREIEWDAMAVPSGIFTVKATFDKKLLTTRLFVWR